MGLVLGVGFCSVCVSYGKMALYQVTYIFYLRLFMYLNLSFPYSPPHEVVMDSITNLVFSIFTSSILVSHPPQLPQYGSSF